MPNSLDKCWHLAAAKWPNSQSANTALPLGQNLVIEVAYNETITHVTEKVRDYWLKPGRVHDAIIVKIDPVPQDQMAQIEEQKFTSN